MAQQASLQVASRSTKGKGAARTLRREGKVPGVIYGHGREAESVTIDTGALTKMLIGISAGTTILDVAVDGRPPVKEVAVTNTIAIPPERRFDRLKVLSIAGLLAKAIGYTHSDQSVSSLFD